MKPLDLTGEIFGKLTILAKDPLKERCWIASCDCGGSTSVWASNVKRGLTKSCGCIVKTHGKCGTRLYKIWDGMKQRCNDINNRGYLNYGGRGIKITPEWKEFKEFQKWANLSGYTDDLTIERKNNDIGYSPENCSWETWNTQARNRRSTVLTEDVASIVITMHKYGTSIPKIAKTLGLARQTICHVVYNRSWKDVGGLPV